MIRIISLVILSSCLNIYSFGQDYFVAFCSEEASTQSRGGHAFIAIGKGDAFTCDVDGSETEVYGFYANSADEEDCKPSSLNAALSYFVGELPGCLFSDIRTDVSNLFVLKVSFEDYLSVEGIISEWKNKGYELGKSDCVSFVIEVANLFSDKLKIPERSGMDNFPNKYVKGLIELNK